MSLFISIFSFLTFTSSAIARDSGSIHLQCLGKGRVGSGRIDQRLDQGFTGDIFLASKDNKKTMTIRLVSRTTPDNEMLYSREYITADDRITNAELFCDDLSNGKPCAYFQSNLKEEEFIKKVNNKQSVEILLGFDPYPENWMGHFRVTAHLECKRYLSSGK